jgi:triphosphoribosyl-dephospho-CoA synthase
MNDPELRADLLEARDARQASAQSALGRGVSILMISANMPGADKHRPGVARMLSRALDSLQGAIGLEMLESPRDRLGPFHLAVSRAAPADAKRAALAIEAASPSGRLLDLDVYGPDGGQLDRAGLGLPPRPCLVCGEPARECILLRRHGERELLARVDELLRPWRPAPRPMLPATLAANLSLGALRELDLTPKPGLVDRRDSGSHPDLSHVAMSASVDLLPIYFEDLLRCARERRPLADSVQAGIAAEQRMTRAIGSNAHRGFIFLGGLALMAACRCQGRVELLPRTIGDLARDFFAQAGAADSHGAHIRDVHGLGGIRAEALSGLPAVFEHGWPRYREALEAGWGPDHAAWYLLAVLMQRVEDTTAVSRCGLDGLARISRDGTQLRRLLERGQDPEPLLAGLNQAYCRSGLTMGGVADCMALTFALQETAG